MRIFKKALVILTLLVTGPAFANEITLYYGGVSASDVQEDDATLSTKADGTFGVSYSWPYKGKGAKGQGELLLSHSKRSFNSENLGQDQAFDVTYGHFSGIAFYPQGAYTTIFGLGIGFTQVSGDSSAIYPSLSVTTGIRYEIAESLVFKLEGRLFGTLADSEDNLFCSGDNCQTFLDGDLLTETQLWAGLAYKF